MDKSSVSKSSFSSETALTIRYHSLHSITCINPKILSETSGSLLVMKVDHFQIYQT